MTRGCIPEWKLGRIVQPLGHPSPSINSTLHTSIQKTLSRILLSVSRPATPVQKLHYLRTKFPVQMSSHFLRLFLTHPDSIRWTAFCICPQTQKGSSALPILCSQALIGPLSVCR